jgi:hypothetical protein
LALPLKLLALASSFDRDWVPPLERVSILIAGLSHVCGLEQPDNLPEKEFIIKPCPKRGIEEIDEGVAQHGIDFLGQYSPAPREKETEESTIKLCMCRMRRFATRHALHFEDVITITLIHELAHFVTHVGKSDFPECWLEFRKAGAAEDVESTAQQATHLYLRIAGYGYLVQVFDYVSHKCPKVYNDWREKWKNQTKLPGSPARHFRAALEDFQKELRQRREKEYGSPLFSVDNLAG